MAPLPSTRQVAPLCFSLAIALLLVLGAAQAKLSPRSFLVKAGEEQRRLAAGDAGPVLVTGATGATGSLTYKALKEAGVEVGRAPSNPGGKLVERRAATASGEPTCPALLLPGRSSDNLKVRHS